MASTKADLRALASWAEQFTSPPQGMAIPEDWPEGEMPDDDEAFAFCYDLCGRCTHRPGMLLNLQELASLVHLPSESVATERLRRVKARTRPAVPVPEEDESIVLGENVHRGRTRRAKISPQLRPRHCYIAGASGTGKSTLLLNMILQDIEAGRGVGLLDPHGDLVNDVLRRIPDHRVDDVILFDPADDEYPLALNILEAKDASERERIVQETVMALERYFPASWGPRLERILMFAIHSVLQALPGATLADVERILTDDEFRTDVVSRTTDPRFLDFWEKQFRFFPKNAVDPVLNKLSPFLLSPTVRNIICQRRSAIDFDRLLNGGKIFLANLSTGLLTEKIAGTFGSFLVTKIVNAAFRRARLPEEERRPWHLYVDEFQAFMNLSVGFDRILAEARKYRLLLTVANQYVGQLSPAVRQAVFGNVAVFVIFRLGVDDAGIVAKELGPFTADEILNLELGEAIVRAGASSQSFNATTFPPPALPPANPAPQIRDQSRKRYSRPRGEVEDDLIAPQPDADSSIERAKNTGKSTRPPRTSSKHRRHRRAAQNPDLTEPIDPREDELEP
ncbi:MAG: ATP-binding protein [Planctomycetia bacterium]|nr:ATP-binding protein [Planctomycetia bacterium]